MTSWFRSLKIWASSCALFATVNEEARKRTDLLNLLVARLRLLPHHIHSALLRLVEALRMTWKKRIYGLHEIIVGIGGLMVREKRCHNRNTAQLLEELLLLLSVRHGQFLETTRQSPTMLTLSHGLLLDVLEDSRLRFIRVLCVSSVFTARTSLLEIL